MSAHILSKQIFCKKIVPFRVWSPEATTAIKSLDIPIFLTFR